MVGRRLDTFWKGFFWGPPSHKRIAWIGGAAGLAVVALPVVISRFGTGGHPLFLAALLFLGLAETGWALELLPQEFRLIVGWARVGRWLCAVLGIALTLICLVAQLAALWFLGPVALGGVLLVLEMAPGGFANRA